MPEVYFAEADEATARTLKAALGIGGAEATAFSSLEQLLDSLSARGDEGATPACIAISAGLLGGLSPEMREGLAVAAKHFEILAYTGSDDPAGSGGLASPFPGVTLVPLLRIVPILLDRMQNRNGQEETV